MPLLDVSFVLDDPMFQDTLSVLRSPIGPDGLPNVAAQTTFTVSGVVQMGSVEPVYLDGDLTHSKKSIVLHSRTRLYDVTGGNVTSGAQSGFQPDIVTYNDTRYKVIKAWDYSRYGQGFYEHDCDILDANTQQ